MSRENLIYHYTNAAGLLGILSSGSVYATDVAHLNDSGEFTHALEVVERFTQDPNGLADQCTAHLLLQEARYLHRNLQVFVACFSRHRDRKSQWLGYSADYCIGLEWAVGDVGTTIHTGPSAVLLRVVYSDEEKYEILGQLARQLADSRVEGASGSLLVQAQVRLMEAMASFKSSDFDDEAEMRVVIVRPQAMLAAKATMPHPEDQDPWRKEIKFRASGRGVPIPYIEMRVYSFLSGGQPRVPLKEVLVRHDADLDAERSVRVLVDHLDYHFVEVARSTVTLRAT